MQAGPSQQRSLFVAAGGEPLKLWLDPRLPSFAELAPLVQAYGAELSTDSADHNTHLLILHPSSLDVFDRYCHPSWLLQSGKYRYQRLLKSKGVEEWKEKLVLTENWPRSCIHAGKLLGEEDNWAGCRKGGPPPLPADMPQPLGSVSLNIPSINAISKGLAQLSASGKILHAQQQPITTAASSITPGRTDTPQRPGRASSQLSRTAPASETPDTAVQTRRARNKYRSVVMPKDHPSLGSLVSEWQNEADPPVILAGKRIFVDSGRNGRRNTISSIHKSGGTWVHEISQATHALLSPVLAEEETARLEYIKQAAAQQVWCVAFEWLESSWDAGQLLPEGNYVYQGGAPRAGVSVARLSDEELDTIFTEAHVDYLSGSKTASQIAVELLEQHGTYTWSTWSQFFTQWRNRAGRFANLAAQQPVTERIVPLPTTALSAPTTGTIDMDKIFRNAHPMSLIPDRAYVDVARHLASIYKDLSEGSWTKNYYDWRKFSGRFRATDDHVDYAPYTRVFAPYVALVRQGVSLDSVSDRLAQEHSTFHHTASEWNVLFGNWLRRGLYETAEPDEAAAQPATSSGSIPPKRTERARMKKTDLARIFREDFDTPAYTARQVGEALSAQTRFAIGSLSNWYSHWRNGKEQFANLPEELRYTGGEPDSPEEESEREASPLPVKRGAKAASPRVRASKKSKNDFSGVEEATMAVYITRRAPKLTEAFEEDWEEFAKENPARPATQYAEHFGRYRARINNLVIKLGGHVPGRRSGAKRTRAGSADSDGSIVFVAAQDKRDRQMEDVEIVEILDSD